MALRGHDSWEEVHSDKKLDLGNTDSSDTVYLSEASCPKLPVSAGVWHAFHFPFNYLHSQRFWLSTNCGQKSVLW